MIKSVINALLLIEYFMIFVAILIDHYHLVYRAVRLIFGLHSWLTDEGASYDTVTTITFGQWKSNRAMTLAAVITGQNSKHIYRIGINFLDKYLVVAVFTIQPFGMLSMRKQYQRHFTGPFHDDIHIEYLDFCFRKYICARLDITLLQRPVPQNLVTDTVRR